MASLNMNNTDSSSSPQWAQLPDEILNVITDGLDELSDYVRFGAVCKSWLLFSYMNYKQKHHLHTNQQHPLLVVPLQDEQEKRGLYDISKVITYDHIQLQLPHKRCCGSSHGWLFFVDNKSNLELILINPFLGESESIIKLPPIDFIDEDEVLEMDEYGIYKAILSRDPYSSPNDYEVVAMYGGFRKLAHYRSGDKFWTYPMSENLAGFSDVIFYKDIVYAVNNLNWIVKVTLQKFKKCPGHNSSPCFLRYKTISKPLPSSALNRADHTYLVGTSKGELMLVRRYYKHKYEIDAQYAKEQKYEAQLHERRRAIEAGIPEAEKIRVEWEWDNNDEDPYAKPNQSKFFEVYKLNFPSARRKKRMETLNGKNLFIGDNHSFSISTSRCLNIISNSIYYTDDYMTIYKHNIMFGSCDSGIFNIKNGSFHQHFVPSFSAKNLPPPIFIVPPYRCNAKINFEMI